MTNIQVMIKCRSKNNIKRSFRETKKSFTRFTAYVKEPLKAFDDFKNKPKSL